jgi:acyl carrier protein
MRRSVQFSGAISTILRDENYKGTIFLEVGPGKAMSSFIKQHLNTQEREDYLVMNCMRHSEEKEHDRYYLLDMLAKIWCETNVEINWKNYYSETDKSYVSFSVIQQPKYFRVPLPTYPFERKAYFIEKTWKQQEQQPDTFSTISMNQNTEETKVFSSSESTDIGETERQLASHEENDPIETNVMQLFQNCLGVPTVRKEDNFFDMGGDSLLALNLISQLRERYGSMVSFPSFVVIQNPTVSQLTSYIKNNMRQSKNVVESIKRHLYADSLIQIQRGSRDKIPLFLIHAIGGDIFTYYKVAQGLGSDQTVYAFRALSLDNQRELIDDIKYMAKVYIEVLLEYYRGQNKRLPSFAVGGHSFGGIVAYEMAQQLYSVHNIQVSLLILIDTKKIL